VIICEEVDGCIGAAHKSIYSTGRLTIYLSILDEIDWERYALSDIRNTIGRDSTGLDAYAMYNCPYPQVHLRINDSTKVSKARKIGLQ
jgi:hypothetical protein